MASFGASGEGSSPAPAPAIDPRHDPFVSVASPPSGSSHHRFSNFDAQVFALGPQSSPGQAKRALEAHLAETDRRMEEAGKLGTALLQQRKELTDRLREVEKSQTEGELSDDLRLRLVEIEKDYNDVARESARAFLPKQRVPSNEVAGSPFVPEGKSGRRSVSPSKFEAQATGSPTKFSVPNRKLRNQPANRIHDIEFAAEISTSLIAQEEELKEIKNEKAKLEYEAEGFQQRVKTLDESEHRYKDENWSLETQVHDLLAREREAQDREKKLNQALNLLQAEKTSTQRELDEVKLSHSKLSEDFAAAMKHHDIELGTAKRNIFQADTERTSMRRKIEDLTGQNQELAKAVSASQRARIIERESILGMSDEDFETAHDKTTPEHSPPPSPVKGTPRHSMLESETLKTSLGHAQRTIQGLRNNVHREKTEKLELKRMLQEARDELEKMRSDPLAANKRSRKPDPKELKKPSRLLGGLRTVRSEVFSEDSNWEDQPDSTSPTRSSLASRGSSKFESVAEEPIDRFDTANETSDAAFETANEPVTETDDFHTGAEEFSSDDDDDAETETESPSKRRTPRNRPSFAGLQRSGSMHSTASTEDDEYPFDQTRTPTMLPPLQQRFPLRVARGAFRRSRQASEEPAFPSSPPSIASSTGTPQQIQSLAAELGDFDGSDVESTLSATPSRRSIRGRTVSPPPPVPPLPRVIMIDSAHAEQLEALKSSHDAEIGKFMSDLQNDHVRELEALKSSHAEEIGKALAELRVAHGQELEELRSSYADQSSKAAAEAQVARAQELDDLKTSFNEQLSQKELERKDTYDAELEALKSSHVEQISMRESEIKATHATELENLKAKHGDELINAKKDTLGAEHESAKAKLVEELSQSHSRELEDTRQTFESESTKAREIEALVATHAKELETLKSESTAAHIQELDELKAAHIEEFENQRVAHQSTLNSALESLKNNHTRELEEFSKHRDVAQQEALDNLHASHAQELAQFKSEADAALVSELEALQAHHASILESYEQDSAAEKEKLIADHAAELEALRKSLEVSTPALGFSSVNSTGTEPIEQSEPRTPKRDAFIIPREDHLPQAPLSAIGFPRRKGERSFTPEIAEDETRQSPNVTPGPETPESQRPFKEISTNTNIRPSQKSTHHSADQSSQTMLTSDGLDRILKQQNQTSQDSVTITTSRGEVTVTPFDETRARQKAGESSAVSAAEPIPPRRPGSSASARSNRPPLPPNHREVIEAARIDSSSGGKGTMGPPSLPASAFKPPISRPETPNNRRPISPVSVRGTPTPRADRTSMPGYAHVHSPSRIPLRSRQSSVSSFVSEIDTRFNIRGGMGMDASAFGPNTDPRMIQAITQTMIGEYLWKYTRKTGRGEMSENRHRRYFWVHPYTRTLYWSDRDPSAGGKSEMKTKSIPIEAVRIVADDNPMPPGLHRKSLVIVSPGRTVKFTCTTGQRHETWFNALSYLLLRTGDETQNDTEEVAGQITQEDIDEFNPSISRRPVNGNRSRAPPSLSSYNSRTTRNDSPNVEISMSIPTLTPTREREATRSGTLGRISGYWKSSTINSTFSSLRSRTHIPQDSAIYEASEVPDSAEDLRQIIEQQDRAADRLENVRACCDGKHDVGTLPHTKRGRIPNMHSHSHSHTHPGQSTTPTPGSTTRTRA
ncbi:uncharacterized protein F4822DRAFT_436034 [Hypoxylon trugodes]|uniref:uncharacterized protein n=1 Tax=Hypoxylon trugodes TaxID=326681 RepID=UPI00219E7422|nr:uncharacterized protein F4822DRAFT_436034 [Hypoxylon trugodes]KAI1391817.1 hypothetical protein F4822DRAFT_436034 [Hypoxylon trugodes]